MLASKMLLYSNSSSSIAHHIIHASQQQHHTLCSLTLLLLLRPLASLPPVMPLASTLCCSDGCVRFPSQQGVLRQHHGMQLLTQLTHLPVHAHTLPLNRPDLMDNAAAAVQQQQQQQ
jgi:hypothetical protein